jgi:3-hydroxymyristoyl/3-hydroxydecanoyl-(acyl carrier protein) dehydratase
MSRQQFCIPAEHPSLAGHFPGNPVVPGVLLLERVLEAAETLCGWPPGARRLPQVKFLRPLLPGQVAELELETLAVDRLRFRIHCEAEQIASGELGPAA